MTGHVVYYHGIEVVPVASMSRVGPKGQVVLPKELRDELRIVPGDRVTFTLEDGKIVLLPIRNKTASDLLGALRSTHPIDAATAREEYREHLASKHGRPSHE